MLSGRRLVTTINCEAGCGNYSWLSGRRFSLAATELCADRQEAGNHSRLTARRWKKLYKRCRNGWLAVARQGRRLANTYHVMSGQEMEHHGRSSGQVAVCLRHVMTTTEYEVRRLSTRIQSRISKPAVYVGAGKTGRGKLVCGQSFGIVP